MSKDTGHYRCEASSSPENESLLVRVLLYEMEMEEAKRAMGDTLAVQGLWHYVELLETEKERTTASGIHLPDQWWSRQDSTALVLESGPGLELPSGERLPPMVQPGDLVMLEYGTFDQMEPARDGHGERGFVWEPRLLGWLACDGEDSALDRIVPLGEYCLIRIDERPKQAGAIHLSDKAKRPRSGIIEEVGPGVLVQRGEHRGRRKPMPEGLVGRRVHWPESADVVCAGRFRLEWVLIKASDLLAAEMTPEDCLDELAREAQEWGMYDAVTA